MKKNIPVIRGEVYTVEIASFGHSGEGVGRYEDFTIFVPGAIVGEQVEVRISEVKKTYAKGILQKVLTPSPDRTEPRCEIYAACGGCQLQHLSYEGQLKAKQQQVSDAMERIGKQKDLLVYPTIGAENPWNYRNKMQFPVGRDGARTIVGCFAQGSHAIIDTKNCCIQQEENNRIANAVREIVEALRIPVYNEQKKTGCLRHVIGRAISGGIMVVLVTATDTFPQADLFVSRLREKMPDVVSLMQNINTKTTNVIMGSKTRLLWGKEQIEAKLGDLVFQISARSFFQVNTRQAEILYEQALSYAGLTGSETVIDAYCGTGTISLFLARKAKRVIGIEIVEPAVLDARKNAKENGIENVEFVVGDATKVMPRLYKDGLRPDVIVVDPPRAGCTPEVLQAFSEMQPERIVYVSCNPASLARDIAILSELGYKAEKVQPVDMFSQTFHVESIALLQRKISKNP